MRTTPRQVMDDIPPTIPAEPIRFLDQLRAFIRSQNKSWATEKTYILWIKRYIHFYQWGQTRLIPLNSNLPLPPTIPRFCLGASPSLCTTQGISEAMQTLGRYYGSYLNNAYQRTGNLLAGRYEATLIDSERYLLTCYRYIEQNPVWAAGMANHPSEYR